MSEALHADIFFFITSVAVVVLTVAMLIILYYVFVILREIRAVVKNIHKASTNLEHDIELIRNEVKGGALKIISLFTSLASFAFGGGARRPIARKKRKEETGQEESV